MPNIRLLLAEDESIIRTALVKLLDSFPNFSVVGEAKNGHDLIEKYMEAKPDVVLCGISIPRINGFETSIKILDHDRFAKIIFFTSHSEEEYLFNTIKLGVSGYITKSLSEGDLRYAIQSVHNGGKYYMGKTDEEIEEIKSRCCNKRIDSKYDLLTQREKEVLMLVAEGMTSQEVSKKLCISKRTVDCHRFSIKLKTSLTKRSEIVDLLKNIKQFPTVS